jgi:hypothetical protein
MSMSNSTAIAQTTREVERAAFSYDGLDSEVSDKLRKIEDELAAENQAFIGSALRIGEKCQRAQKLLAKAGCKGKFSEWLAHAGYSRPTAYRYIRAYRAFSNCVTVGQFEDTALYLLSSSTVPPAARKQAENLAKDGQRISAGLARKLIESHTVESNGHTKAAEPISPTLQEDSTEFFSEVLDALPPGEKPPKPGSAQVTVKQRKACHSALGALVRALTAVDLDSEFSDCLDAVAKRIKTL